MFKFLIIFLIFVLPSLSFSQVYRRGSLICDMGDFKEAKEWYINEPDNNYAKKAYAECLIAKGEGAKGFSILQAIIRKHNDVYAAFTLAHYIETNGRFDGSIDKDTIDEAIAAFLQVLTFIEVSRDYPYNGFWHTEKGRQMELSSHYSVAAIYGVKYKTGFKSSSNEYMGRSADAYPEHSRHTKDSLEKMLHYAERCLTLPLKAHFKPEKYKRTRAACQVLKDATHELLPLEDKRLFYLGQYSCRTNSSNCDGYSKVEDEIDFVIGQAIAELRKIFNSTSHASAQ